MHTYFLIQGSPTGILFKDSCQERWLDLYEGYTGKTIKVHFLKFREKWILKFKHL